MGRRAVGENARDLEKPRGLLEGRVGDEGRAVGDEVDSLLPDPGRWMQRLVGVGISLAAPAVHVELRPARLRPLAVHLARKPAGGPSIRRGGTCAAACSSRAGALPCSAPLVVIVALSHDAVVQGRLLVAVRHAVTEVRPPRRREALAAGRLGTAVRMLRREVLIAGRLRVAAAAVVVVVAADAGVGVGAVEGDVAVGTVNPAEVVLADRRRGVAERRKRCRHLEGIALGDRHSSQRAVVPGLLARQDGGARGGAGRCAGVAPLEEHALLRDAVHVGRGERRRHAAHSSFEASAVLEDARGKLLHSRGHRVVPLLVRHHEQQVRARRRRPGLRGEEQRRRQCQRPRGHHASAPLQARWLGCCSDFCGLSLW